MTDLKPFKIQGEINELLEKIRTQYPSESYISDFDVSEFIDSSKMDMEYIDESIHKLKYKFKILKILNKNNELCFRLSKYKRPDPSEFETLFTNEVNSSILNDIGSVILNYACSLSEAIDYSLRDVEHELNENLLKRKFYEKSLGKLKCAENIEFNNINDILNINFKRK